MKTSVLNEFMNRPQTEGGFDDAVGQAVCAAIDRGLLEVVHSTDLRYVHALRIMRYRCYCPSCGAWAFVIDDERARFMRGFRLFWDRATGKMKCTECPVNERSV